MTVELYENLWESLKNYFNALSHFGYKKQSDVNKLLMYDFLVNLLEGSTRFFITEEDYKKISRALYCLYGSSCLIPYPQYLTYIKKYRSNKPSEGEDTNTGSEDPPGGGGDSPYSYPPTDYLFRYTEDDSFRFTEDDMMRLKADN